MKGLRSSLSVLNVVKPKADKPTTPKNLSHPELRRSDYILKLIIPFDFKYFLPLGA